MNPIRQSAVFLLLISLLPLSACVTTSKGDGNVVAYVAKGGDAQMEANAPVFVVQHTEKKYNRIGTPTARVTKDGEEEVKVDPAQPSVFVQRETFTGEKGNYTNLMYRVHFEKSPFTLVPFNAGAGENVGFITVVTLNAEGKPVWVTTVQSCGCYHGITPTSYLPEDAYPVDWKNEPISNYEETLPARIVFPNDGVENTRVFISLRTGTHRAMDLTIGSLDNLDKQYTVQDMPVHDTKDLKALPIQGATGTTSFYYTEGEKKGLVKGAYKPIETLLLGAAAGDTHVGQDREYGPSEETGQLFYTTLNRKNKDSSDMWDFAGFLRFNGWQP